MPGFQGQVVWVTGASSGIGAALVRQLDAAGARVVLSARRQQALEQVRQQCVHPERHLVLPLDLECPEQFPAAVSQVIESMGHLDILINNGGISQRSLIADTDMSVYRRLMEVNYFSAVALTQAVLPIMQKQKSGHVVVTASIAGLISTRLRSGYGAAKAAIIAFCESLQAEVWDSGIAVTVVCPGGVNTEISTRALVGNGGEHGVMDSLQTQGLSAEECARQILLGIVARKPLLLVAGREKLAVYLKRLSPALSQWLLRHIKVT